MNETIKLQVNFISKDKLCFDEEGLLLAYGLRPSKALEMLKEKIEEKENLTLDNIEWEFPIDSGGWYKCKRDRAGVILSINVTGMLKFVDDDANLDKIRAVEILTMFYTDRCYARGYTYKIL